MPAPGATPAAPARCACGTELAPAALACPVCGALVHAEALKALAATATRQAAEGASAEAAATWRQALELLPAASRQHGVISERIGALLAQAGPRAPRPEDAGRPWWARTGAALAAAGLFALGKLKFLALGLGKATTFFSMFAFFGVYWSTFGWPLALGLVVSIYIHEMGHVWELRRAGVAASAPVFIPGVGALVRLRQHVDDPRLDARIGLAGPIWGLGAGVAAVAVYLATRDPIWKAIAQLGGYVNLFNLIPLWQLDGSRAFHALVRWQRWVVVGVAAGCYLLTTEGLLLVVGGVAAFRALERPTATEPDGPALAWFVTLVGALTWLSSLRA